MKTRLLAAVLAVVLFDGASQAQITSGQLRPPAPALRGNFFTEIPCPGVHVSISADQPGWSSDSPFGEATSAYVSAEPGQPARLTCQYTTSVTLSRPAPPDRACIAVARGFRCWAGTTSAPPRRGCPKGWIESNGVCAPGDGPL